MTGIKRVVGARWADVMQQDIVSVDDLAVRVRGRLIPGNRFLIVTSVGSSDETDQRVGAVSLGLSVREADHDHASARREINRADGLDYWPESYLSIDGGRQPARILQLLTGDWVAFARYGDLDVRVGVEAVQPEDLELVAVDLSEFSTRSST